MVTRRQSDLETMRSQLIEAAGQAKPMDLPRITRELRAVNAELDALAPSVNADQQALDELKERRATRRSASKG